MSYEGFSVYDDADFFQRYQEMRSRGTSVNDLIEQPIIDELLAGVSVRRILDLGCGDGTKGAQLMENGAAHYVGIEGSENMATLAKQNLQPFSHQILHEDIAKLSIDLLDSVEFDLVISRLVFHYIKDLLPLFEKINSLLIDDGVFIFSVEHPVITSCHESYLKKAKRTNWLVDNYFASGERKNLWIGKEVIKYHRTIEDYWKLINESGFEIVELRESKPRAEMFDEVAEFERRMRIPLLLIFKLKRKSINHE